VTCEGMLQVVPMLVPRATEIEEPMVSAFMRTNEWRYYCMDAEVLSTLFGDSMGVATVVDVLVNYKIL